MPWPEETQVRRVKTLPDGRAGWHVDCGTTYPGKVIAPAGADAAWVADAVRRFAKKVGSVDVSRGRLYTAIDLEAEVGDAP